jgi:hypothetical protein
MKNIKFVVKVNRGDTHAPEYVQRVDPTPIHMTTNRKRALVMGKFMAEDAVKSLENSRHSRSWCRYRTGPKLFGWFGGGGLLRSYRRSRRILQMNHMRVRRPVVAAMLAAARMPSWGTKKEER